MTADENASARGVVWYGIYIHVCSMQHETLSTCTELTARTMRIEYRISKKFGCNIGQISRLTKASYNGSNNTAYVSIYFDMEKSNRFKN